MRLKPQDIKPYRERLLSAQGYICVLCGKPATEYEAVLDHDHNSGKIRGVLHRGCNALLGKIENNYRRCGIADLHAFLNGCSPYLKGPQHGDFHPSYRTEEEKRLRRNKKASKRRKAKKQ